LQSRYLVTSDIFANKRLSNEHSVVAHRNISFELDQLVW